MAVGTTAALVALGTAAASAGSTAYAANQQKKAANRASKNVRDPGTELRSSFDALQGIAPARYGLTAEYMPKYTALETQRDRRVREAGISDAELLAPRLQALQEGMNPETYALIDSLVASARTGIDSGGALTAEQMRDAQQQSRAASSARGLALGQDAAFAELLNLDRYRRERLAEDRQFATTAAGLGYSARSQALPAVLGITGAGYGTAATTGADPTGSYFADAYNTNLNAAASRANAAANSNAALWGAGINAIGQLGGAYLAGRN